MLWNIILTKDNDIVISEQGLEGIKFSKIFRKKNPCDICLNAQAIGFEACRVVGGIDALNKEFDAEWMLVKQSSHSLGLDDDSGKSIHLCSMFSWNENTMKILQKIAEERLKNKKLRRCKHAVKSTIT